MSDEKVDRLFKWIDIIKVVLYLIVAGAVGLATWATKIQIQVNENKSDIEAYQANVQHNREVRNDKDLREEHRFTVLEQWKEDQGR